MKSVPLIVITTLSVGILTGYFVNKSGPAPEKVVQKTLPVDSEINRLEPAAIDHLSDQIADLEQRLVNEIYARQRLEENLDKLNQQLAKLDPGNIQSPDNSNSFKSEEVQGSLTTASRTDWFNTQALLDVGMNSSQATELKSFFEQQELDRMYLRDQSVRENWDRQKYREALQKLTESSNEYLDQLDKAAYDAYLYASGQPNRVRVTSVLDSSQAGSAGIQAGDHIISYDNKPVYSGFELRSATTSGDINQTVAVEIERDGEIQLLYLNRGPLGIRMNSVSVAPTP